MSLRLLAACCILPILLGACVKAPASQQVLSTPSQVQDTPVEAGQASPQPTQTGSSPISTETAEIENEPTQEITTRPVDMKTLAGLVYELKGGQGVYLVQSDGKQRLLTTAYRPVISPDMQFALHSANYDGDIWLTYLSTGEVRNLTQTPDVFEMTFRWWEANPDMIVFTAQPVADLGYAAGKLSLIHQDGTGYQVLDDQGSIYPPAPGPDGRTIAFDRQAQPWLWHLDAEPSAIAFQPDSLGIVSAINPVWSPDGTHIAWRVWGENNSWTAVGVYSLLDGEWRLLHRYQPLAGGEAYADLAWSPDGRWIATVNQGDQQTSKSPLSLWVLEVTGGEEHYLGSGSLPVWDPTSTWLVFFYESGDENAGQERRLALLEVGKWQVIPLDIPPEAIALGWFDLAQP